jgi:ATP-dependent helicase/nuclease subunit B
VAEAAPRLGLPDPAVEALPRRITDRVARRPAMRWFLPPADLAQWMAIQGHDPARLLRAVGRNADLFRHATEALERIEDDSPSLTAFDGRTGSVPSHWSRILRRGIAPTPLERYARCPFQYFAADVLRLEPVRVSNPQEPDALELGTLCHATLRRTYESLLRDGWPAATLSADRMKRCVADAVTQAAAECEREGVGRHYLLWEMAKEQIASLVVDAVAADEETLKQEGYQPVAFELEAGGTLALTMGDQALPLKIHGRVDRVDRHRESGSLRIIDYKYKAGSAMKPEDNHLRQAAARGYRLQPPFYASLDLPGYGSARDVQFFYLAPHWPARIARRTFEAANRSPESGTLILRTITTLMEGIRDGRFFILPDTYCKTCDYRVACRREHQQTWWRAHRAPEAKSLRSIRSIKINDE